MILFMLCTLPECWLKHCYTRVSYNHWWYSNLFCFASFNCLVSHYFKWMVINESLIYSYLFFQLYFKLSLINSTSLFTCCSYQCTNSYDIPFFTLWSKHITFTTAILVFPHQVEFVRLFQHAIVVHSFPEFFHVMEHFFNVFIDF